MSRCRAPSRTVRTSECARIDSRMSRLAPEEIIARADANYFASFAAMAARAARGEVRARAGLLIVSTGTLIPALNAAFATRRPDDPDDAVRYAIAYYDAARLPFVFRVRDGVDAPFERAAEAAGFAYSDSVPAMALTELAPPGQRAAALEVRAVRDEEDVDAFVNVQATGFDMPGDIARAILSPALLEIPDTHLYVGHAGGEPVAASALMMTHRVAGIYNVATLPEHRGNGFGEAITRHAVAEGFARGALIASLQASEMGRPVYERMGFKLVAEYRTFVRR